MYIYNIYMYTHTHTHTHAHILRDGVTGLASNSWAKAVLLPQPGTVGAVI
jgi:hypothetical protein